MTVSRADFRGTQRRLTSGDPHRAVYILRAKYNVKAPDALQVAAALEAGCEAFLTHDFGLRRITDIKIVIVGELELDADKQEPDKNSDG